MNEQQSLAKAHEELFDRSAEYDAMLTKGIQLSGENKHFFIAGRLNYFRSQLPTPLMPSRILDFGCGLGDTTQYLARLFPHSEIVGIDASELALEHAQETFASDRISFQSVESLPKKETFSVCYVNGVFHHIPPAERLGACVMIRDWLLPGGYFALFENNPWNPGARMVMRRIAFDRDAQTLTPLEAKSLVRASGFVCLSTRFLFYFPHALSWLRFSERWLARLPLGAQYCVLAQKTR